MGTESFHKFQKQANRQLNYGEFAENITTEGIILYETHPLDRFIIGEALLEVTQIGKNAMAMVVPFTGKLAIVLCQKRDFCRVLKPGIIQSDDTIEYQPKIFKVKIITLSDRASTGEYEDRSGPKIMQLTEAFFAENKWKVQIERLVIADDAAQLQAEVNKSETADIIITTGGTGIGPATLPWM